MTATGGGAPAGEGPRLPGEPEPADALRTAEAALRRAQEAGGVGLFALTIDDDLIHPTREFCRLYGLPERESFPATLCESLIDPRDLALTSDAAKRRTGTAPRDVAYRIRRADDGATRWIARRGEFERDEAGRPVRFVGAVRDITAQVEARIALEAEREQLAQMFEQAPTFMALLRGPEHRFERANPGYVRLAGGREVVGRTVAEALPEAVQQGYVDLLDEVYRSGRPYAADGALFALRGEAGALEERFVDFVYQPLRDAAGEVVGIFVEGADVTARRQADEALRRSEERYRTLFEALDTGFAVAEVRFEDDRAADGRVADCRFLEVNPAFARQTGLAAAPGRRASEIGPDLDRGWIEAFGRVAGTGEAVRFESGSEAKGRWLEVHAFRIGDPAAGQVGILLNDVSERRRAELALWASQERLQEALTAGEGIGTWDWDFTTNLVRSDARFADLYRVDPAEAARGVPIATFFAHVHPDDLPHLRTAVRRATKTGEAFSEEYRLLRQDGSIRWVVAQGRCRLGADGSPLRFPGVSFDITARKRAEARQAALVVLGDRLRDLTDPAEMAYQASEILGTALEVSRVGYGVIDKVAETITIDRDWNGPGIRSLAGVLQFRDYGSYIENLKRGETVVFADAERDPRTAATAAALKAISAQSVVNMPLVEHGQFVALLYANHAMARAWSEDELAFMREVAERVHAATERARAEAARRASEEQFRVFAQAVPNQIWAAGPDGTIDWFNDQAYAYAGAAPTILEGGEWGRLVHPDDLPGAAEAWASCLATGQVFETEFRIRRADGAYRWFLVRAVPVRREDGAILRWVGTSTDIHDRKRQAAELARLNETLELQVAARTRELMAAEEALRQSQKMEAVGQLTGGLAHDFNNLLTGITGSLDLLNTRIAQGRFGDVERYTAAAQGAAKRAAALTHRLLAFSRRQTLDPRPTNVNGLVAGLEELVRRTVGPAIHLEVVAAGGLWPTLVDPNQLENAILNLCINARDAMPEGGRLTIETANRWLDSRAAQERDLVPGQYISVCVSDTGTGMAPEVASKAFDPFFTTKPLGVGTGLGLSMIYGFTRQSGGQTRIYSRLGEGTMVCLYLPRHLGEADEAEAMPDLADAPRAGAGETVLVVDDEPTVRMLVMEVLEELGYAAIEAADGASGLKVLQSDVRIDLLVSDVGLPGGMNGRQMADAARLTRPDLRILFITGYAENAVVGNGQLEPGMHVMTKPFALEALASRIRELISRP